MVKKPKNPEIRKKWKPEALDKAMEAVRKKKLTIRQDVSLYCGACMLLLLLVFFCVCFCF